MGFRKGLLNLYSKLIYYTYINNTYNICILLLDHLLSILSIISIFPLQKEKNMISWIYLINPKSQLDMLNNLTYPAEIFIKSSSTDSQSFYLYTNIFIIVTFAISGILLISAFTMFFNKFHFEKNRSVLMKMFNTMMVNGFYLYFSIFALYIFSIYLNKVMVLISLDSLSINTQMTNRIMCYFAILALCIFLLIGVSFFYFFSSPFPVFKLHIDEFNRNDFLMNFALKFFISLNNTFQDYYSILMFKFAIILLLLFYLVFFFVKIKEKYMNIYSIINMFYLIIIAEIIAISIYNGSLISSVSLTIIIEEILIILLANIIIYFTVNDKNSVCHLSPKNIFNDIYKLVMVMLNNQNEEENIEMCVNVFQKHKFNCNVKECSICRVDISLEVNVYRFFYKFLYEKNTISKKKNKIVNILLKLMLTFKIDEQKIHRISIYIQKALKEADLRSYIHIFYFYNYLKNLNEKENLIYKISINFLKIYDMNKKLLEDLITFIKRLLSRNLSVDEIITKTTELGILSENLTHLNGYNDKNKKVFTQEVEMIINFLIYKFVFNRELKNYAFYNMFDNYELAKNLSINFEDNSSMIIRFDPKMNIWKIKSVSNVVIKYSKYTYEFLIDKNFDFLFPNFLFPDGVINEYFSNMKEDNVSFKSYFIDKDNCMFCVKMILKFIPSLKGENLIYVNIDFDTYKTKINNSLLILDHNLNIMLISNEFYYLTTFLPSIVKKIKKLSFKDIFGVLFDINTFDKYKFNIKLADLASNIYNIQSNSDMDFVFESKKNIYLYMVEKIPNMIGVADVVIKKVDTFHGNKFITIKVKFKINTKQKTISIRKRPIKRGSDSNITIHTLQKSNNSISSMNTSGTVMDNKYNKILLNIPEYKITENSINNSILDRIVVIICYLDVMFLLIAIVFIIIIQSKLSNLTDFFDITSNFNNIDCSIYNLLVNVNDMLNVNIKNSNFTHVGSYIDKYKSEMKTDLNNYLAKEMGIKLNDIVSQYNQINTILTKSLNQSTINDYVNFEVKYYSMFRDGHIYINRYKFLDALNYFNNELIILTGTKNRNYNLAIVNVKYIDENNLILLNFDNSIEKLSIYNVIFNYFPVFHNGFNLINDKLTSILYEKLSGFIMVLYYFLGVLCLGNIISIIFTIISIRMYITRINSALNFIFSLEISHYNYLLKKFELMKEILFSKIDPTYNFKEIKKLEEDYFNSISFIPDNKLALYKKNGLYKQYERRKSISKIKENEGSYLVDNKKTIINQETFNLNKSKKYYFKNQKDIKIKTYFLLIFYAVFIVGIFLLESILMNNIYTVIQFKSNFLNIEKKYIINVLSLQYLILFNSTNFLSGNYKSSNINTSFFDEYSNSIYSSLNLIQQLQTKKLFSDFYNNETLFEGENFCTQLFSNPDYITDSFPFKDDLNDDLYTLCVKYDEMKSNIQTILSFIIRESRSMIDNFISSNRSETSIADLINNSLQINEINVIIIFFLRRYFYFFSSIVDESFNREMIYFFVYHILVFLAIILYDCISLVFIKFLILDKIVVSIHHTKVIMGIIKH